MPKPRQWEKNFGGGRGGGWLSAFSAGSRGPHLDPSSSVSQFQKPGDAQRKEKRRALQGGGLAVFGRRVRN